MDLKNAQLGDQYRIFVDSTGQITDRPNMRTMLATVIATKKPKFGVGFILGWKKDEERPSNASPRSSPSEENDYVANHTSYVYGKTVAKSLPVAVQIHNGLDGFPCKECQNFYPQALPNQNDGTLICWSCRNRW